MTLALSPQAFSIFALLLEEKVGLHYRPGDGELLSHKLSLRAEERDLDSLLDYYYLLRYDDAAGDELARLVETLVVHETYLFRERDQLEALVDRVLPPLLAERGAGALRLWSAACSTGEEPATLAVMLAERGLLPAVELLATDLSERALAKARRGVFSGRSLRSMSAGEHAGYLEPQPDGSVSLRRDLRAAIRFERANLVEPDALARHGTFDAILCRNALIYFSEERVTSVVASLTRSIREGGVLAVGVSESLLRFGSALECQEYGGAFFYRKKAS